MRITTSMLNFSHKRLPSAVAKRFSANPMCYTNSTKIHFPILDLQHLFIPFQRFISPIQHDKTPSVTAIAKEGERGGACQFSAIE